MLLSQDRVLLPTGRGALRPKVFVPVSQLAAEAPLSLSVCSEVHCLLVKLLPPCSRVWKKQNRERGMPSGWSKLPETVEIKIREMNETKTNQNEVRIKLMQKWKDSRKIILFAILTSMKILKLKASMRRGFSFFILFIYFFYQQAPCRALILVLGSVTAMPE